MPKPGPKKREPRPEPDIWDEEKLTNGEQDIEDFLDEWSPGTSVVEVYEMKRDGSRPHLERVDINILKADLFGYLREHFGAGKYLLQFKDAQRRIRKALVVDVGGPKGTTVDRPANSFMEQMLLTLIATQKPAPAPPPLDIGTMMAGLGAMLTALRPVAPTDPATMLAAMAQTFQQLKPAEDNVEKALTLISKAKDLTGSNGNGGDGGDGWAGLVKDGVAAVAQVFTNRAPAPAPGGLRSTVEIVHPLPLNGGALLAGNLQQPEGKTPDMLLQEWIQAQIAFLKTKARAGKDPAFWVDYTLENQEEPGYAAILEAMRRGATFQHLLSFDAEIGHDPVLSGWFQTYYEDLHAALNENVDSGGPGGDAPDPGRDEKPSTD